VLTSIGRARALLWIAASTIMYSAAGAQSLWVRPTDTSQIYLEYIRPQFYERGHVEEYSGLWTLGTRISISNVVRLQAEIPYVYYDNSEDILQGSGLPGNPYVGLEFGRIDHWAFLSIGMRLPLAPDDEAAASQYGLLGDYYRYEAYWPEMADITALVGVHDSLGPGITYRSGVGVSVPQSVETAIFGLSDNPSVRYFGQLWLCYPTAEIGVGVIGRASIRNEPLVDNKRTVHELGAVGRLVGSRFRPGIYFRLPLSELNTTPSLEYVVGVNFAIVLGET
jgi:hypothetical protein